MWAEAYGRQEQTRLVRSSVRVKDERTCYKSNTLRNYITVSQFKLVQTAE